MIAEQIIKIESNQGHEIHLVKDRIFWQAWERSAFLFVNNIKKYKVRKKFVQKVSQDLVWLGFPELVLKDILEMAVQKRFEVHHVSADHIVIQNVPEKGDFENWKNSVTKASNDENKEVRTGPKQSVLLLFRICYDFTLYVSRLVPKFGKSYKFSYGEHMLQDSLNISELVYLNVNHDHFVSKNEIVQPLLRLRLDFRLLKDLKQISLKQWLFVNQKIEEMLQIISPESARSRTVRECVEESSILPSAPRETGEHRERDP